MRIEKSPHGAVALLTVKDVDLTKAELETAIENFACHQGTIARDNVARCHGSDDDVVRTWEQLLTLIAKHPVIFQNIACGYQISFNVITNHLGDFDIAPSPMGLFDAIDHCRREYARLVKYESIVDPGEHGQFYINICPAGLSYEDDDNCVLYRPPA